MGTGDPRKVAPGGTSGCAWAVLSPGIAPDHPRSLRPGLKLMQDTGGAEGLIQLGWWPHRVSDASAGEAGAPAPGGQQPPPFSRYGFKMVLKCHWVPGLVEPQNNPPKVTTAQSPHL